MWVSAKSYISASCARRKQHDRIVYMYLNYSSIYFNTMYLCHEQGDRGTIINVLIEKTSLLTNL